MIARAFLAVLLAVLTLGACIAGWASSAWAESKLSGDLFVTMQSGDVKRGADVLVALVATSPAFVQEWETVNTQYEQEVAPLVTEYDRLDAQQKALLFSGRTTDVSASIQRDRGAIQVLDQMINIGKQWTPIQDKYTKAAMEVIAKHTSTTTRTDVNGHFEVSGLQPGNYVVYANHSVFKKTLYWFVPVDLGQGDAKLSLSNSNAKLHSSLRGRTYY